MEQQLEDERSGRLGGRPPIRLPLHRNSSRRSRSLSPFRHDDDANMYALSRPAGEAGDSGDEPSLVRETAPTRAEEPTDYYRRPPPRDEDYHRPPPRAYDDALADIRPTIDHITARMIHYRNKAATSGLDSKAIIVETLAAEAWMKAFADREIDAAQEMTNGPPPRPPANPGNAPPPTPDQVELAKCRRALAAAKRALEDNERLEPSSPEYFWASARARAASALAEISEALEDEER